MLPTFTTSLLDRSGVRMTSGSGVGQMTRRSQPTNDHGEKQSQNLWLCVAARENRRDVNTIALFVSGKPGFSKRLESGSPRRPGLGAVELIVIVGIIGFAVILFLMALPRGREASRMTGCQRNLMQVGVGLQMYHQAQGHYPTIPGLGGSTGEGPIKAMLDAFVIPDLLELHDASKLPKPSQAPPKGVRVPGLACPSDLNAMAGSFLSSLSYRANTGDTFDGLGGPFQPGRTLTSSDVEAADGLSFTAAFAERLVGDGRDGRPDLCDYARSPDPVSEGNCEGLASDRWRGDAGSDWSEASWRSTLYNHALVPNASNSCISEDGRTARIGASSGHLNRINVLLLDGSLRAMTSTIDLMVWRSLGTIESRKTNPSP